MQVGWEPHAVGILYVEFQELTRIHARRSIVPVALEDLFGRHSSSIIHLVLALQALYRGAHGGHGARRLRREQVAEAGEEA